MRRSNRSPTLGLLTGVAVTLSAVAVYSGYTIFQLRGLRQLQTQTIDRNRTDSLLLLRIQNDLNSMALTIRDILDANQPYPLAAWQGQCRRIRIDLDDAMAREPEVSPPFLHTGHPRPLPPPQPPPSLPPPPILHPPPAAQANT